MDKNVIVSIFGRHTIPDMGTDTVEFVTDGLMSCENGDFVIKYQETLLTGGDGTATLRVNPCFVSLTREGSMSSHMVFEKDKRHMSVYETTEGSMMVGVMAYKVDTDLGEHGGDIDIGYAVEVDYAFTGDNNVKIKVRES